MIKKSGIVKMINVFIITSKKRDINELRNYFANSNKYNLNLIEGIFLKSNNEISSLQYDSKAAKVLNGRDLTLGEIGCALAHNNCRRLASESDLISLILEDDAVITQMEKLDELVKCLYRKNFEHKNIVLNISKEISWQKVEKTSSKLWKLTFGQTPLAAGYLVSKVSAKTLLDANEPIKTVADWPYSDVQNARSLQAIVNHNHEKTRSLISDLHNSGRSGFSKLDKIAIYSFIYFFIHKKFFLTFKNYLKSMWWPRLKNLLSYRFQI
jgi:GR25 family glycosyltransferase involved in LPS biosynthesis